MSGRPRRVSLPHPASLTSRPLCSLVNVTAEELPKPVLGPRAVPQHARNGHCRRRAAAGSQLLRVLRSGGETPDPRLRVHLAGSRTALRHSCPRPRPCPRPRGASTSIHGTKTCYMAACAIRHGQSGSVEGRPKSPNGLGTTAHFVSRSYNRRSLRSRAAWLSER